MRYTGRNQGKSRETLVEFHVCSEEDFVDFAPPNPDAERRLNAILEDPHRGLYCIDWKRYGKVLSVWGISSYEDF